MRQMVGQIIKMRGALWVNAFLYYFSRLWMVGRLVPPTAYAGYRAKKALSAAAVAVRQIIDLCGKPLYLLTFLLLPVILLAGSRPQFAGQEFSLFLSMLFFLSCILGAFGDSHIFNVTREKVAFLKYLHADARSYIQASLALRYVPFFSYYLPFLLLAAWLFGAPLWQGAAAWVLLAAFRMMSEAFHLFVFDRTGRVLVRSTGYAWLVIAVGLAGAYVPPLLGLDWHMGLAAFLLHPASISAFAAAGALCLYYIAAGYPGYARKLPRSLDLNFLLSSMLKTASGSSFKEVEVREADAALSSEALAKLQRLKGYDYLNALFFARHRRQLLRPVWYRLAAAALAFAAAAALRISSPELAAALSRNLTAMLPSFVFIMYSITVADKSCRAMFYNCDKDLLRYAWYRKPKVILRSFGIRLRRVALYNGLVAGALCLAAAGFCLISGTGIFTADLALFCAALLLLSLLFTAHHLCLYYIFQPYSESLKTKNPLFSGIHAAMYLLCFACLQIEVGGSAAWIHGFVHCRRTGAGVFPRSALVPHKVTFCMASSKKPLFPQTSCAILLLEKFTAGSC